MTAHNPGDDKAIELDPDFSLKEKIGKDITMQELLSSEVIDASQTVINHAQKDFLVRVGKDIKALENSYNIATKNPAAMDECVDEISKIAFSLKSQAGTFGYDLGSAVAKSLYDFCENDCQSSNIKHLTVLRFHIDTLATIFTQQIFGEGGDTGAALNQALTRLVEKFRSPPC